MYKLYDYHSHLSVLVFFHIDRFWGGGGGGGGWNVQAI